MTRSAVCRITPDKTNFILKNSSKAGLLRPAVHSVQHVNLAVTFESKINRDFYRHLGVRFSNGHFHLKSVAQRLELAQSQRKRSNSITTQNVENITTTINFYNQFLA